MPFKISGLSVGDEILLYFDYKVEMYETNKSGQQPLVAALKSTTNNTTFASALEIFSPAKTDILKWTRANAKAVVNNVSSDGADTFYLTFYVNYNVATKLSIDNIVVVICDKTGDDATPNGYYEKIDGTLLTDYDLNPNMYGTPEDGMSGDALKMNPLNVLKNGDFSEGLKYWGNHLKNGVASSAASIKTEDDNSYLVIDRSEPENAGKGIISVPVKISNLAVGDEISLFYDYRVKMYDTNKSGETFYIWVKSTDSETVAFEKNVYASAISKNVDNWSRTSISGTIKTLPDSGEGVFYVQLYLQYKAAAEINLDNIVIAIKRNNGDNVTPEGYYDLPDGTRIPELTLNPTMYGTETGGINGNALTLNPLNTLKNGDFSEGLKYWGNQTKSGLASAVAFVQQENNNDYLVINREEPENAGKGIISVPVKISNLAVGDEISLFYDYRLTMKDTNIAGEAFYIWVKPADGETTSFEKKVYANVASKNVDDWSRTSIRGTVKTLPESGDGIFYVQIYLQYKAAAEINLDNIVIAIKRNSGDNITPKGYYDLLDGIRIPELSLNPTMYGTETDGINGNATMLTPLDSLKNGDFSEGLKYWGNQFKRGLTSAGASVEKTGNNNYLVIERKEPENAPKGVISVPFMISDLKEGDVIAVMYDYKTEMYDTTLASNDFYANLLSTDEKSFKFSDGKSRTQISSLKAVENETVQTPEGWTTTAAMMIVGDIAEGYVPTFYIQLYMQYKAAGKICFDNFQVYVRHNSGDNKTADGYYETLDGKLVSDKIFKGCTVNTGSKDIASGVNDTNYPGLVYSWIGTEEDGIYTDKNYLGNNFPVRTKFMNSDFSKGLQYWFESTSTGYTSQEVALRTESNGNHYISVGENGESYQINQTRFWLQNFEPGDKVYIMIRFRKFGNHKCDAYVHNAVDGEVAITRAHGTLKVVYEPESDDDWGYSVSNSYLTIPAAGQVNPKNSDVYGGNFSYYMMITAAKHSEISDIMLVRKNADGTYTDSDGNAIIVPKNTNNYHYDTYDGFDWSNGKLINEYGVLKLSNVIKPNEEPIVSEIVSNKTTIIVCLILIGFVVLVGAGVTAVLIVKRHKQKTHI